MKKLTGGLENISGFKFSAMECNIRYKDRLDFTLIYSDKECNASGMFTRNRVFAAPVKLCKERIDKPIRGILVNATNANACTGEEGYENAVQLTARVAEMMDISEESVLMSSTGVIGYQLPLDKMLKGIPSLTSELSQEKGSLVPEAIMTTDTFPKSAAYSFNAGGKEYKIAGTAKGSGMIAPDMATLLSFVITDAPIAKKDLDTIFRKCINRTFNSITIDGDTSTNDTAIILSPANEEDYISDTNNLIEFEKTLMALLKDLSLMLVKDGEGATKSVTISVEGAKSDEDARKAAKSVAESLLVKTAFFGEDPNWGRIACAAGYSGADFNMDNLNIFFENCQLLKNGTPLNFNYSEVEDIIKKEEFTVKVHLGAGEHQWEFMTCDISYDYVKINGEYTT